MLFNNLSTQLSGAWHKQGWVSTAQLPLVSTAHSLLALLPLHAADAHDQSHGQVQSCHLYGRVGETEAKRAELKHRTTS